MRVLTHHKTCTPIYRQTLFINTHTHTDTLVYIYACSLQAAAHSNTAHAYDRDGTYLSLPEVQANPHLQKHQEVPGAHPDR